MRRRALALAALLILTPPGARAADLVVWWDEGYYARRTRRSGRSSPPSSRGPASRSSSSSSYEDSQNKVEAAVEAGQPPDFAFGFFSAYSIGQWAYDDRLVDLSDPIRHSDLFDPDVLGWEMRLNARPGRGLCTGCRWARDLPRPRLEEPPGAGGFHPRRHPEGVGGLLVLLVRPRAAGRASGDGPRRYLGCRAVHVGQADDTRIGFLQFMPADGADYVTRDGKLVIDDPEIRRKLIETVDRYTAFYRKGCTPPDAVDWSTTATATTRRFLARS